MCQCLLHLAILGAHTFVSCFFLINYGEGECYTQLRLSHDSQESPFVDSCAYFFDSLWHHEHVLCTCSFVLLLFSLCVHWTPCLVLNPPFHNSKITTTQPGYINSIWLILSFTTFCVQDLPVLCDTTWLKVLIFLLLLQFSILSDNPHFGGHSRQCHYLK